MMEIKTLGELCNIVSGGTPSRSKAEFWNDGTIPWIKIGNIKGKYVNEADEYITQAGLDGSSAKLLSKGTVLYTIFATLGEVGILSIDACTNQAIAGLTIKNENQLNTDYLYYYLKSKKSYVNNVGRGVAQNNINMSILRSFELPLPEMPKQKEIVDVLDKAFSIIEARQKELQKLDELIKARFIEMFGSIHESTEFPYLAVREITDVVSGGTPSRDRMEFWNNGTIPWVKTTELQNNIITTVDEYITEDGLNGSSAKIVPAGTVLIAMYGQGKTRGMTGFLGIEASTNQACACILPSQKINPVFLWKYFELSYDKLRDMAKGGNQPNLNGNIIKNFPVLMPPMALQEEYVAFVKQVDKSKVVVQAALDKTQLLFDSLMQEYFG